MRCLVFILTVFVSSLNIYSQECNNILNLGEDIEICEDEFITLDAGEGFDYYLWNTRDTTQKISITESGTYSIQASTLSSCSNDIKNGLSAYYPFNGNANDESGNNLDGSVIGPAALTLDRFGNLNAAYQFNGLSGHIVVDDNNLLDFENTSNSEFSISLWFKRNSSLLTNDEMVISKGIGPQSASKNYRIFYEYGGPTGGDATAGLWAQFGSSATNCSGNGQFNYPFNNQWHHIVMIAQMTSINNGIKKTYIDGELVEECNFTSRNVANNQKLYIGSEYNNNPGELVFDGAIDDVGIWQRALCEDEVKYLYYNDGLDGSIMSSCLYSDSINISISDVLPPTGEQLQYMSCGNNISSLTVSGANIKWYLSTGEILGPTTELVDGETYYASQTVNGCESQEKLGVTVEFTFNLSSIELPNHFTPNLDGYSDKFEIRYDNILGCDIEASTFEVRIYDRYFRLVYEGLSQLKELWDGSSSNGSTVGNGIYYYEVVPIFKGERLSIIKGKVFLER